MSQSTERRITIVIVARLMPESSGGIAQAVLGTVAALGRLDDGDERYIVVTDPAAPTWLNHLAGPNTRVVPFPEPFWRAAVRRYLPPLLPAAFTLKRRMLRLSRAGAAALPELAPVEPFIESLGPDVVHFPFQMAHRTTAPSIFNPQDLQHIHYPEFFDAEDIASRTYYYQIWCRACTAVDVPSFATKADLIASLGVAPEKIYVIPKASQTEFAPTVADPSALDIRTKYGLPDTYILFPAQAYPHKNHIRLLEALAELRTEHNVSLPLVCIGHRNAHWKHVEATLDALRLHSQVYFLGFVPATDISALYRSAQFTVFPTLFEGGGIPILEAFREGSPLACSNLPVLVEQAGDAACYFDPLSKSDIARALLLMHRDERLRRTLTARGTERAKHYTWDRTAQLYRALYRRTAGLTLTEADRLLLHQAQEWPPPAEPVASTLVAEKRNTVGTNAGSR